MAGCTNSTPDYKTHGIRIDIGLDGIHFEVRGDRYCLNMPTKTNVDDLSELAKACKSYAEVIKAFGEDLRNSLNLGAISFLEKLPPEHQTMIVQVIIEYIQLADRIERQYPPIGQKLEKAKKEHTDELANIIKNNTPGINRLLDTRR